MTIDPTMLDSMLRRLDLIEQKLRESALHLPTKTVVTCPRCHALFDSRHDTTACPVCAVASTAHVRVERKV